MLKTFTVICLGATFAIFAVISLLLFHFNPNLDLANFSNKIHTKITLLLDTKDKDNLAIVPDFAFRQFAKTPENNEKLNLTQQYHIIYSNGDFILGNSKQTQLQNLDQSSHFKAADSNGLINFEASRDEKELIWGNGSGQKVLQCGLTVKICSISLEQIALTNSADTLLLVKMKVNNRIDLERKLIPLTLDHKYIIIGSNLKYDNQADKNLFTNKLRLSEIKPSNINSVSGDYTWYLSKNIWGYAENLPANYICDQPNVAATKQTNNYAHLSSGLEGIRDDKLNKPVKQNRLTFNIGKLTQIGKTPQQTKTPLSINGTIIANKKIALPMQYAPGESMQAHKKLFELIETARKSKDRFAENLGFSYSGYRSYQYQVEVYQEYLVQQGERANDFVALPGYSEHQSGLAFDLRYSDETLYRGDETTNGNIESNPTNPELYNIKTDWVFNNAWRFGFVVHYWKQVKDITGYSGEPWHLRYLGLPLAKWVYESKMPIEKYFRLDLT